MSTTVCATIHDGGNKFELFAQLGDIGRVRKDRPAFPLTIGHPTLRGSAAPKVAFPVLINGIQAEDGSGNCWLIQGRFETSTLVTIPWLEKVFGSSNGNFRGFYNTRTRTGFISTM